MQNINITKFFILLLSSVTFISCSKESSIEEDPDEIITFVEPDFIQSIDILFTGSSTIAFWPDLDKSFATYHLINTAASGTNIDALLENKETRIFKYNPSFFIFYYGDNDMYVYDVDTYLKKFKRLMKEFKIRRPNSIVLLISIKPSPKRSEKFSQYKKINSYMSKYHSINPLCHYIDIWTPILRNPQNVDSTYFKEDLLHLSNNGYTLINQSIINAIKKLEHSEPSN